MPTRLSHPRIVPTDEQVRDALDVLARRLLTPPVPDPPTPQGERLLSLAETAERLGGVSQRHVRRLINSGDLPSLKVLGRRMVRASDLDLFIVSGGSR